LLFLCFILVQNFKELLSFYLHKKSAPLSFPKINADSLFCFSYYFTGLLSHSLPVSRSGRNCFPVFGATKVITLLFLPKIFSTFLNLFFGASQTSK